MLEFAIVAVPLVVLTFGIIEVALIAWGTFELENATTDAARLVRTGQAQQGGFDATALTNRLCERVSMLSNCKSKVRVDVRTSLTFAGITSSSPFGADGALKDSGSYSYDPGGPGQIVIVTAYYEWTLINFSSIALLSNMGNGNRLLQAAVAFKNEPFRNQ